MSLSLSVRLSVCPSLVQTLRILLQATKRMTSCIASIDQGTSSTRVLLVSVTGSVISSYQLEHTQHYPTAGFVEHDPLEIWKNVKLCLCEAIRNAPEDVSVKGIGITNQRETTIVWNKHTGKPYHNAIVWNDVRTSDICEEISNRMGSRDCFRTLTGLPIASYFSASKLIYLLSNVPDLRNDAENGDALFGTVDSWLIWRLTNGAVHATDVTNASRTLLMNIETLVWDDFILNELMIPKVMLPCIHPSSFRFGVVDGTSQSFTEYPVGDDLEDIYRGLHNVAVAGVLGDQQSALFGQACFHRGDAKCTYGTGAFLLFNTGHDIIHSSHGLLTTVAYQLEGQEPVYALEGSIAYSGSVIQWLRDNLEMIHSASETEAISLSVKDNGGVYFVPAFAGLYAPYWRDDARGIIAGLTAYNTRAHIVRAALEASAFQTIEITAAMNRDSGSSVPLKSLKVDGGLTSNNFFMQFQCDLLDIPLIKPRISETTALGAAFVAGLQVELWSNLDELQAVWQSEKYWQSDMNHHKRAELVSFNTIMTYSWFYCLHFFRNITGRKLWQEVCFGETIVTSMNRANYCSVKNYTIVIHT
jgi:glycerol kinase